MSDSSQMQLIALVKPEGAGGGIAWEMRDDSHRVGHGTCQSLEELRGVEIRSGIATVRISGAMTARVCAFAESHGWETGGAAA